MKKNRFLYRLILFIFVFSQFSFWFFVKPKPIDTANLTSASATLSNARLSYRAGVASGSLNSSTVTIDAAGNPDNDTNHLFPKDTTCFTDAGLNGCIGSTTYTVANIIDSTTFNLTSVLGNNLDTSGYAVATQSGSMTIAFTTVNQIPSNGDILITIPAVNADNTPCDGFPDTAASTAANGFDLGPTASQVGAGDITVTGCTDGDWNATETVTCGSSSADHTIRIDRQTSVCAASSAITVTIDNSPGLRNPAPVTSGHTQGIADIYTINVTTRDGSNNTIDQINTKVAPIEAVLVSATVETSLSLTVAGVTADSGSYCGITRTASSPDTSATSVPWGTLASAYAVATHNTQQQLTVSTNADGGYKLYIEENDQMGKDGVTCTGAAAGESVNCIQDTTCGATPCTHTTAYDWGADPSSYPGLGYSLENTSGTDAKFVYNSSASPCTATAGAGNFCAKQMADQEVPETRSDTDAEIMTNSAPVDGSSAYVCFRIDITGTQPAGYYFNIVKYTAVATF